jgi:hypothetical protein
MTARLLALALSALPLAAATISIIPAGQIVPLGDQAVVTIDISGLAFGAAPSVGAFDLDLSFDSTILSVNNVAFGNQLDILGLGSIFLASAIDANTLNLFELSLDLPSDLDTFQADAFTLATITFDTLGPGTSNLTLALNALGDPDGLPLAADLANGSIEVQNASVPEPSTLLLTTIGLLLALRRRVKN